MLQLAPGENTGGVAACAPHRLAVCSTGDGPSKQEDANRHEDKGNLDHSRAIADDVVDKAKGHAEGGRSADRRFIYISCRDGRSGQQQTQ